MVVEWLMLRLTTMEVKGSNPFCGMVEASRPTSGQLA